jgi:hypothetical protein
MEGTAVKKMAQNKKHCSICVDKNVHSQAELIQPILGPDITI